MADQKMFRLAGQTGLILMILALMTLFAPTAHAQDAGLDRAYKKEFAYLKAQKEALQKRLDAINGQTRTKTNKAKAEVDRLQGRLVSLSLQSEELEEALLEAQRSTTTLEDRSDTVVGIIEQSKASLGKYDVEIADPGTDPAKTAAALDNVFSEAARLIEEGGQVRKVKGGFFDKDGSKVEGELIHVGRVASYGVASNTSGVLAPAGEGRLKLWPEEAAASAKAIATGSAPSTLSIFLYENLDKPIDEKKGKTWLEIVEAGGVIAWVIVFIGLLAFVLIILRAGFLMWVGRGRKSLSDTVVARVQAGHVDDAIRTATAAGGPLGRVLADTLKHLGRTREVVEDIASEAVLRETPALERFGNVLMVFAAVSPLLGLLGTVTGMISTFDIITEYGTGDPKMLSGGISEALITTQLGLIVAIPALLFGNLLNSRANSIMDDLEHSALRVVNASNMPKEEGPTPQTDGTAEAPAAPRLAESAA